MELVKRKRCYVMPPSAYEIAGCACGNHNTQWSEYEGHLWCAKCEIDFIPEHGGMFDGPIPIELCKMLGISFDMFDIETGELIKFETITIGRHQITRAIPQGKE